MFVLRITKQKNSRHSAVSDPGGKTNIRIQTNILSVINLRVCEGKIIRSFGRKGGGGAEEKNIVKGKKL